MTAGRRETLVNSVDRDGHALAQMGNHQGKQADEHERKYEHDHEHEH